MSELLPPAIENVFTEEYWGPLPPLPAYKHGPLMRLFEREKMLGVATQSITSTVRREVEESLGWAVNQIMAHEPLTAIEEGEIIGGPNDNEYALPGAVILVDRESVWLSDNPALQRDSRLTDPKRQMQATDMRLTATGALLSRMTSTSNSSLYRDNLTEIAFPFQKVHIEPGMGLYKRTVALFGFCQNRHGKVTSISPDHWVDGPGEPHAITYGGSIGLTAGGTFGPFGAVGETINTTLDEREPHFSRIQQAYLCLPGNQETAKVTQKTARSLARLSLGAN